MKTPEKYIGLSLNEAYVEHLEKKIEKVNSVVNLANDWCEDQENEITDGSICISAMKDIRRTLRKEV
jgi:hypothetical protein